PADLFCTADGHAPGLSIADVIRKRAESVHPAKAATDFRMPAGITAVPGAAPGKMPGEVYVPEDTARSYPAVLVVSGEPATDLSQIPRGRIVLVIHPQPWPTGTEAAKAPIQGAHYLLSLRATL